MLRITEIIQLKSQYNLVYTEGLWWYQILPWEEPQPRKKKAKTKSKRYQFDQGEKSKERQQKHQSLLTSEVVMNLIGLPVKCS